ncbi:hypothetical protein CC86DRAFT_373262 [Ophiobolus disseminans]|uniref:Ams2/SPT21 N-terminal domain-containing protein n=1 Tax=Ophiobolus disseminans TaxID=1469910 RepID=A0A6A6ZMC8_9PLEO|nr:hypothetical protein CC86DRAFT_373262 [Ophiobolus disseminans]
MSTPTTPAAGDAMQQIPSPAADDEPIMSDIPRRSMRVKVLYTFDDQNKSNCLARLPNALNVPVVSLDENTQVGIIELKTCIQAIVAASPELIAKLGHDYTVYAYDFSEYETPLVGQGMLSWILASASSTPNAPAEESRSMVTGRVCKNILGLFGHGMKETLEVKLKLVPVPTSMQHEYVENMERYHSLSQLMPANFDYNAWSDFLKENPTLSQLAQPTPMMPSHLSQRSSLGGYEPFHEMLTRNSPSQEPLRTESFYDQSNMSFNTQPTRASSPAMSTLSFHHYQYNPDSRPASRASVRSESTYQAQHFPTQQYPAEEQYVMEQQEEGPPKKRARIVQTKRPKKTPLTAHNDSLRVTASTAASVRLHRPLAPNPATSLASAESIPRAPTPQPGDVAFGQRGARRPPAPSALRHASIDESRPYMSPYDSTAFSDNAMDSPDEGRGESPGETVTDMPSSPPLAPQRTASPDASSPPLPTLPLPNDSGFVSDMGLGLGEDNVDLGSNIWDGSDLPVAPEVRTRRPPDRSGNPWQQINPGPTDRLPQSYVPRPKQHYRKPVVQPTAQSIEQQPVSTQVTSKAPKNSQSYDQSVAGDLGANIHESQQQTQQPEATSKAVSPNAAVSHGSPNSESDAHDYSRSCTPNPPTQKTKAARGKGLTRSQTWSGTVEPMSDAPTPSDPANPRSGSGARRKKYIKEKLAQAIAAGELPEHCKNCGEIDTPTWRKAFTRIEYGSPEGLKTSKDTTSTAVIAFEVIEPTDETGGVLSYRIFKNNLTREEKDARMYEELTLCNPCGLWFLKKCTMRPRKIWDKSMEKSTKRKRQPTASRTKSVSQNDGLVSDAAVPHSEPVAPEEYVAGHPGFDGNIDGTMPPPPLSLERASSFHATVGTSALDGQAAEDALRRAIQSSPAGLRGSRDSPIDVDPDLTPKPTRRLLFPSPRQEDDRRSLSLSPMPPGVIIDDANKDFMPEKPRCQRCKKMHKSCDRERPCGRCDNADIGFDGCIPGEVPRTNWFENPVVQMASIDEENPDKENCPPPPSEEHDDLAHLFEDPISPKTTPQKDAALQDLLKTPTPGSRHRNPLSPRRGADDTDLLKTPTRMTPSRNLLTPRGTRAATVGPETPFTRQLNALLSEGGYNSPSQAIDFSSFPTFNTPGRAQYSEFLNDDFLSSDMPSLSSTPKLGLGFELYEDPNTSTASGLWSGVGSMFGSDTMMADFEKRDSIDLAEGPETAAMLKMHVGGVTLDFSAMIEDVATDNNDELEQQERAKSSEAESLGLAKTPDVPVTE